MRFIFPGHEANPVVEASRQQQFDQLATDIQKAYSQAQSQPRATLTATRKLASRLRFNRQLDRFQKTNLLAYLQDADGCARIELGQIKQGLAILAKAARTYQTFTDKTPLVNNLLNQARAWLLKNDMAMGVTLLERSLLAAKEGRLARTETDIFFKLGILYNMMQQPAKAIEVFGKGLLLSQQTGNHSATASFLAQFGQYYLQNDELEKAFDNFERSRSLFEQENDLDNLMVSYGQLDQLARKMHNYSAALEYANRGLELARQQANRREENVFLQDLARIYLAQEDYAAAESLLQESLALAPSLAEPEALLRVYELMSQVAQGKKNYDLAQQWLERGLSESKTGSHRRDLAVFINELADLKLVQGETTSALEYFDQLAVLFKELEDWPTLVTLYVRMAEVYLDKRQEPAQVSRLAIACFELVVAQPGLPAMTAFTSAMRLIQLLAERRHYPEGLEAASRCLSQANTVLSRQAKADYNPGERQNQSRWMLFSQVLIILVATLQDLKTGQPRYLPKVRQVLAQLVNRFGDNFTLEKWTGEMYERLK